MPARRKSLIASDLEIVRRKRVTHVSKHISGYIALTLFDRKTDSCGQVPDGNKGIKKMGGGPFDVPGLSKFKLCTLMQGKIESFYIDNIKKYSATQIERGVIPESLEIDEKEVENRNAYPLTIKLRHLTTTEARVSQSSAGALDNGVLRSNIVEDDTEDILEKSRGRADAAELVKAKYVIGCDGAHSWTRQQIASRLEGDSTDYIFGVVDIVPISDFRKFSEQS
jgi:phenol 2-monooxygenase